jgi:hypothetical protein
MKRTSAAVIALLFAMPSNAVRLDTEEHYYDQQNGLWRQQSFVQKKAKADGISPETYDPWVYKIVKENIDPFPLWHERDTINETPWVTDPSVGLVQQKHHKHHNKPDIAERGMDEEVHGFVWHALPPLNTWVRSDDPFVPNGSDPSAIDPDGLAFAQNKHHHHSKDIAERAMEDHFVHPFSNDQDVVMPTPNPWLRPYLPY